ncbi:MAG TPA: MFS transporter [Caulobacterales bacterium]|nr:MFS transporter [Caulobacterales bacterium]
MNAVAPPRARRLTSRVVRVTAVMCALFAAYGLVLPYLGRWLENERHLNGAEIGAVLSLSQLTRIVVGPLIAFWADGAADRRTPIRVLAAAAVVLFAAFFFLARDFPMLLALGFLALTCSQGLSPFVEGAVLRASEEGKVSYGLARGVGSAAFIIANILGGLAIARFGIGALVVWVMSAYALIAFTSWAGLKPEAAPPEARASSPRQRLSGAFALMRTRRFIILITACGLIQAAHGFYYGFSTILWRGQGVPADTIGLLWGFGTGVEVVFLWSLPLIERRMAPEALILLGAGGACTRWILMGLAPSGLALWPVQALHALSFASTHVGAMRLLYRETPAAAAGLAQTLYAALSSGLFMGLATLASGVLYDAIGVRGYWAMALVALCGGLIALLLVFNKSTTGTLPTGEHRS